MKGAGIERVLSAALTWADLMEAEMREEGLEFFWQEERDLFDAIRSLRPNKRPDPSSTVIEDQQ